MTIGSPSPYLNPLSERRAGFQNSKALAGIIIGIAWIVLSLILQLTMGLLSGIFQMGS